MELYKIGRGTKYKLNEGNPTIPPDAPPSVVGMTYTLGRIDGMYSWSIGEDGKRYYFAAWTDVEVVDEN